MKRIFIAHQICLQIESLSSKEISHVYLDRLIRSGMDCFFSEDDAIKNIAEYMTSIRELSGVSSASLVVAYILLERFVAGVFFDFDELVVFSSKSARRLLIAAVFTASKIYDADSPKGFWSWYQCLPFIC
jgi:hypothetical protein